MMIKLYRGVKAGKLADGWEKGKGQVVHLIQQDFFPYDPVEAICGDRPSISWSERDNDTKVTCKKCLKKWKGWQE
jgi:hypothetical protein